MNTTDDEPNRENQRGGTREAFDDLEDAMKRLWDSGRRDARRAAEDAVPRMREEFHRSLHDLAWGVAYVASFGAGLIREMAPDSVNHGWEEGHTAGKKAARTQAEKRRRAAEETETGGGDPTPA